MSGEKQFKTFSRRKKASNPANNNAHKIDEDEEEEKGEGRGVKTEDEERSVKQENTNADEAAVVPSSSAESQGERGDNDGGVARNPIENGGGGGGSTSVSRSATRKRKSGNGNVEWKQQPKQKRIKEEIQSQQGEQKKQRKEDSLKAKPKPKQEQEEKKNKGIDGKERDVVKMKKKVKDEDAEEEESAGCRFPVSRVDRIIRSEGTDCRITHEAVFLINKATEKFLEIFCEDSYKCAAQDCKNYVSYYHLCNLQLSAKRIGFYFLSDYVPEKVKAEQTLAERKPVEK